MTKTGSVLTLKDCGEGILAIVFDRPDSRVNLVDERWLIDMTAALDEAEAAAPKGLLLLSAKPGNFIAGADISLIASLEDPARAEEAARTGQALLDRLEDLPFPTVAAIGGSCLGGGFETAMACTWRVAADGDSVILGLPEVRLGILPGFGGTWRLPRLTGVTAALPLILTGGNLRPKQALARGVVDRLAAPELLEEVAAQVARTGVRRKKRPAMSRLTDSALGGNPIGRAVLRSATRRGVLKKTGGHYPAAPEIIDRVIGGLGLKRKKAMAREAEAFGRLAVTPESKSLLFLFQGSEALARHPWTGAESPVDRTSAKAGVIGAGTMGGGIAGALATRGLAVRLKDTAVEPLRVGLAGAAAPLNRRTRRRALHPRDRDAILARISPTTGDTGMADAAFVIEAVPEVLDLKIAVFRALEDMLPPTAYLATNTSSIPISRIAAGLSDPTRLVGIHFFNPVDRMPLVEIIPGEETAPEVLERAVGLVRRLKKTPLVVADRPGFLVNRLLLPYLNEAAIAVAEGVGVDRIDRAMKRFGMPMGPLRVLDEVGIDVAAKVSGVLEDAFGERARPADIMPRLLEAGALGAKAGRGFWAGPKKKRRPNTADLGISESGPAVTDQEITDRLMAGMLAEAARCLADGVVREPDHLDIGSVMGFGFPPFLGGVARWARSVGEEDARRTLEGLAERHGTRFTPPDELGALFR